MTTQTWAAPGPGEWTASIDHFARPLTPISQRVFAEAFPAGFRTAFAELGAPLDTLDMRFVNGVAYVRPKPIIDKPGSKPPPRFILRLACALHPEMRRRNKAAERSLDGGWRRWADRWWNEQRADFQARNRALQAVELTTLDDEQLLAHVAETVEHLRDGLQVHFEISPVQVMPFGVLCVAAAPWGISPEELLDVLVGCSPATTEPIVSLEPLREELRAHGCDPTSLEDIRSCSPRAEVLLTDWLRDRRWIMTSGYDIDQRTLGELPHVIVAAVRADAPRAAHPDPAAPFHDRVPTADWPRFLDLVADAREAFALRDDNGPFTGEWTAGLVRRALLEVGRRLVERGSIDDPNTATSATEDELTTALAGDQASARAMAERERDRLALAISDIPSVLGETEIRPDPKGLPGPLRAATEASLAILDLELGAERRRDATALAEAGTVNGHGINEALVRGRARVARNPEDLFDLEPGDIIVTPATSPTWNMVLASAGGLVVEEGGLTGHAAIVSRELGLPALIGAKGAASLIPDGAEIELDTVRGEVRL